MRVWVLRGCSLQVEAGERVAIVGRRGAGKTTLLRCLAGERRVDAGSIDVNLSALLLVDEDGIQRPFPLQVSARAGDAIIVAARDVACVQRHVDRVLLLTDGRLTPFTRTIVRQVAERSTASTDDAIVR